MNVTIRPAPAQVTANKISDISGSSANFAWAALATGCIA
jgi:hypothetical protein